MTTIDQLKEVFSDNFVAYFRSHIAHLNVTGRNFASDHKLLQKVYEDLQGQIDTIGELIRSLDDYVTDSIDDVVAGSSVLPLPMSGSADEMLAEVQTDLEQLKGCYEELIEAAEEEGHDEIANYAQDRILTLAKFIWMFKATLEE
jgi:DNA-binding ferritin-like protein